MRTVFFATRTWLANWQLQRAVSLVLMLTLPLFPRLAMCQPGAVSQMSARPTVAKKGVHRPAGRVAVKPVASARKTSGKRRAQSKRSAKLPLKQAVQKVAVRQPRVNTVILSKDALQRMKNRKRLLKLAKRHPAANDNVRQSVRPGAVQRIKIAAPARTLDQPVRKADSSNTPMKGVISMPTQRAEYTSVALKSNGVPKPLTLQQRKTHAQQDRQRRQQNRAILTQHWDLQPHAMLAARYPLHQLKTRQIYSNNTRSVFRKVEKAIQVAIDNLVGQLGKPYVWGGQSPQQGFDCSGLIYYVYNKLLNQKLPRTADEMYSSTEYQRVSKYTLKPGDLIFFAIKTRNSADHVGVYLGKGKFIEAPRTGEHIRISDFAKDYWQLHYLGARRILTASTLL